MILIRTFLASIPRKWLIFGGMVALCLLAVFMAYRATYKAGQADITAKVEKASNEAAMDAVNGERRANANSDARQDEFEAQQAEIRKDVDDAKANGDDVLQSYADSVRRARSGGKDKAAD